jgi:hypothetical protein
LLSFDYFICEIQNWIYAALHGKAWLKPNKIIIIIALSTYPGSINCEAGDRSRISFQRALPPPSPGCGLLFLPSMGCLHKTLWLKIWFRNLILLCRCKALCRNTLFREGVATIHRRDFLNKKEEVALPFSQFLISHSLWTMLCYIRIHLNLLLLCPWRIV